MSEMAAYDVGLDAPVAGTDPAALTLYSFELKNMNGVESSETSSQNAEFPELTSLLLSEFVCGFILLTLIDWSLIHESVTASGFNSRLVDK